MIKIEHQSIANNWIKPHQISNPKTLVLGSFNPYTSKKNSVDYYYGRNKNHFWKTIALIYGKNENYFFQPENGFDRKLEIMKNKFCCVDVIDSIEFKSEDSNLLEKYVENEVLKNFLDQKIWRTKTFYKKQTNINLVRHYNYYILDFLNQSNSINKIIHTMGEDRITNNQSKPKEKNLNDLGFAFFIEEIKKICINKNIEFILESYSPSDYAIKTNKTDKIKLNDWLKTNLYLGA